MTDSLKQLLIALIVLLAGSWVLLIGTVQQNDRLHQQLFEFKMEAVKRQQGVFVQVSPFETKFEWKK